MRIFGGGIDHYNDKKTGVIFTKSACYELRSSLMVVQSGSGEASASFLQYAIVFPLGPINFFENLFHLSLTHQTLKIYVRNLSHEAKHASK